MKRKAITFALIFLILVLVCAYPIYAIVIRNTNKSPDDISNFPKSGVWICEKENFVMTIDLQGLEVYENPVDNMKVTIKYNGGEQKLFHYHTYNHGTFLEPMPSHILTFESEEVGKYEENYIQFETHKYKFNENDLYFLDISVTRYNKVDIFKDKMDLHFIKSINNEVKS